MAEASLPPPVRTHLERLTGRHGIYQHARGPVPDPAHGTCTDDVARALSVDLLQARQLGWTPVATTAVQSLAYLEEAFDADTGRFRNFRADDGTWLDGPGSPDAHGRAMLALGALVSARALAPRGVVRRAEQLFAQALPGAIRLRSLRPVASTILGCVAVTEADERAAVPVLQRAAAAALARLARRLSNAFPLGATWPWPEPAVTYEGFLLPRALIAAGGRLDEPDILERGRLVLDWLVDHQVDRSGAFHPVGNDGWWPAGAAPGRFDQQPIEAGSLLAAADEAHIVTGNDRYVAAAEAAFGWFTGRNDLGRPVAIAGIGSCHDGLQPGAVNANQGAESTLAWLGAVEHLRAMRARVAGTIVAQRSGSTWPWGSGWRQDRTYSRRAS